MESPVSTPCFPLDCMYTSCLVTSSPPPQFLYWPQTVVAETRSVPQSIFPTHSHGDESTYYSDTRLNKEQATGISESLTMSRCPVLYTSNKDSLFQEAWRIHCQKDRQGINLDIWKIITFKIKLFTEHGALLLQSAVTSATSAIFKGAGNKEEDSAPYKLESCGCMWSSSL